MGELLVMAGLIWFICHLISKRRRLAGNTRQAQGNRPVQRRATPNSREYPYTKIVRGKTFRFLMKYKGGGWRAYIKECPSYGNRSQAASIIHYHFDSEENCRYICWSTTVHRLDDMVHIADEWSRRTENYIRTGVFG